MKIKQAVLSGFKRFNKLSIIDIPATAKLVVLAGPNGCGKSSVFDAFRQWFGKIGTGYSSEEKDYHLKEFQIKKPILPIETEEFFTLETNSSYQVEVKFHDPTPTEQESLKKLFYFRTAYRSEPHFISSTIQRIGKLDEQNPVLKMIDTDITVQKNYQRLVSDSIDAIYEGKNDDLSAKEIRVRLIGKI